MAAKNKLFAMNDQSLVQRSLANSSESRSIDPWVKRLQTLGFLSTDIKEMEPPSPSVHG